MAAARCENSVAIGVALASPRDGDCVWREFIARAELIVDLEGLPDGAWDAIRACDVCFELAADAGGFAAPRQCVGVDDARDVLLGPAPPGPARPATEDRAAKRCPRMILLPATDY